MNYPVYLKSCTTASTGVDAGEFGWTFGVSHSGMPETTTRVRNVWSGNMALRRTAFDAAGGFREDFGKVGTVSSPEDTELCLRVTDGRWLYEPTSAVSHWVPARRATLGYFLRRRTLGAEPGRGAVHLITCCT